MGERKAPRKAPNREQVAVGGMMVVCPNCRQRYLHNEVHECPTEPASSPQPESADARRFRYLHTYLASGVDRQQFRDMTLDELREWCDLAEAQDEAVGRTNDNALRDFAEYISAERLREYRDLLRQAEELDIDTGIVIDAILESVRRNLEAP